MERTWSDVPTHDLINLEVQIWVLDDWNLNEEGVKLDINGVNYPLWSNLGASSSWVTNKCGNGAYKDLGGITIQAKINHSASSLTLKFYSGLDADADVKSFGIRDLKVRLIKNINSEPESFCGVSHDAEALAES